MEFKVWPWWRLLVLRTVLPLLSTHCPSTIYDSYRDVTRTVLAEVVGTLGWENVTPACSQASAECHVLRAPCSRPEPDRHAPIPAPQLSALQMPIILPMCPYRCAVGSVLGP